MTFVFTLELHLTADDHRSDPTVLGGCGFTVIPAVGHLASRPATRGRFGSQARACGTSYSWSPARGVRRSGCVASPLTRSPRAAAHPLRRRTVSAGIGANGIGAVSARAWCGAVKPICSSKRDRQASLSPSFLLHCAAARAGLGMQPSSTAAASWPESGEKNWGERASTSNSNQPISRNGGRRSGGEAPHKDGALAGNDRLRGVRRLPAKDDRRAHRRREHELRSPRHCALALRVLRTPVRP